MQTSAFLSVRVKKHRFRYVPRMQSALELTQSVAYVLSSFKVDSKKRTLKVLWPDQNSFQLLLCYEASSEYVVASFSFGHGKSAKISGAVF